MLIALPALCLEEKQWMFVGVAAILVAASFSARRFLISHTRIAES